MVPLRPHQAMHSCLRRLERMQVTAPRRGRAAWMHVLPDISGRPLYRAGAGGLDKLQHPNFVWDVLGNPRGR
eukprot:5343962-Prymnesium_polylepis.1